MKKILMVSNSWRPSDEEILCGKCGKIIEYNWGEYSFRYSEEKDKSDLIVLCKSCAVQIKDNDKKVKVISRSPLMELINLKNSGWKPQPKKAPGRWSSEGSAAVDSLDGEIDSDKKEDADK
jgi:hypothetical protein